MFQVAYSFLWMSFNLSRYKAAHSIRLHGIGPNGIDQDRIGWEAIDFYCNPSGRPIRSSHAESDWIELIGTESTMSRLGRIRSIGGTGRVAVVLARRLGRIGRNWSEWSRSRHNWLVHNQSWWNQSDRPIRGSQT